METPKARGTSHSAFIAPLLSCRRAEIFKWLPCASAPTSSISVYGGQRPAVTRVNGVSRTIAEGADANREGSGIGSERRVVEEIGRLLLQVFVQKKGEQNAPLRTSGFELTGDGDGRRAMLRPFYETAAAVLSNFSAGSNNGAIAATSSIVVEGSILL